jgi:hypothetical protein
MDYLESTLDHVAHFRVPGPTVSITDLAHLTGTSPDRLPEVSDSLTISANSLAIFLASRRSDSVTLTRETCYDLFLLAHLADDASLTARLRSDVLRNPGPLLIPALLFSLDFQTSTDELMPLLKANLFKYPVPDLATVPLPLLTKCIRFPSGSDRELFNKTFELVLDLYDSIGVPASLLFQGVHREQLSPAQNNALKRLEGFVWEFIDNSSLESIEEQHQKLADRITRLEGLQASSSEQLDHSIGLLRTALREQEETLSDRVKSLEGIPAVFREEIDSITVVMDARHEELSREIAGLKAAMTASEMTLNQHVDSITARMNDGNRKLSIAITSLEMEQEASRRRAEQDVHRLATMSEDVRRTVGEQISADVAMLQSRMNGIGLQVEQLQTESVKCQRDSRDVQFANGMMISCLASVASSRGLHSPIERFVGGDLVFSPSVVGSGAIGHFRKTESVFMSGCALTQSSGDVFSLIDPDSQNNYGSSNSGQAWIKVQLRDPVMISAIRIQVGNRHLPRDFDVLLTGPDGEFTRAVRNANLNTPSRSETYPIDAMSITAVTITQRGPAWDGDQHLNFRSLELFAPDGEYASGVFRTLFNSYRAHIREVVSVTARDFDLGVVHSLTPRTTVCTFKSEHAWVEVAFDNHRLLVNSYRLDRDTPGRLRSWRLVGTNNNSLPLVQWTTIDSRREANPGELQLLELYACLGGPFRYFRIVQQEPNWNNKINLRFKHIELFGALIPIE